MYWPSALLRSNCARPLKHLPTGGGGRIPATRWCGCGAERVLGVFHAESVVFGTSADEAGHAARVGWVEAIAETHHNSRRRMMGFALLYPSYSSNGGERRKGGWYFFFLA